MCGTVARVPTYNPKPGLSGRTLPGGPSGAFDGAVVADPPSYAIRGRWAGSPTRYTNGSRPELQSHSQRTAQANLGRSAYRRLPAWRGDPTEQQDRDTRIFGFRCYRRPAGRLAACHWPQPELSDRKIRGQVIEIDSFGNLVTNIAAELFAGRPTDTRVCVVCGIYETFGIYHHYAAQAGGMLVALVGSTGRLELAVVGDNAAARLGVAVGTPVALAWE